MQNLINNGITEECHLVYLLTCIRKVLEQKEIDSQYDLLKFYCDWALHAQLSGRTAQSILSYFNDAHLILNNGEKNIPPKIRDISGFNNFKNDLNGFLNSHSITLPDYSCSDWSKFILLYASVIEDCPLNINCHLSPDFNIKNVTAKVALAEAVQHGQQYYKVSWIITDKNNNEGEFFVINSFDA